MEIVSALSSHWLETAVAVYLIGMVLYGHYRGFIRLAVSLVSLVAALLVVWAVMRRTGSKIIRDFMRA